jgi:two-component system LytT family response regulator
MQKVMVREKKIRTIIVDDEPIARRNLWALLKGDPEIEIIGQSGSGTQAVKLIKETLPDLLFLDVQMPEVDGFEVLKRIKPERLPAIIFVTAYDQYALKAFEVHALDYLLKPFNDERFALALERAKAQIKQRNATELSQKLLALLDEHGGGGAEAKETQYLTKFLIKSASRVFFVKAEEIDWIEAADYYVQLHTGEKSHLLRETMADLESRLDPKTFLRIHRSTIVNLRRVKEVQMRAGGDYFVVLESGTELKLSRSRREQVEILLTLSEARP